MNDAKESLASSGGQEGEVELGGTLTTEELRRRPPRRPDYEAESRALTALAEIMSESPGDLLQKLVETALELCRADSAGISILEEGGESGIFRWHAIAGECAHNLNGTMPRQASPCGTVLERDTVLLFDEPARHFRDLLGVEPKIHENLLVPFHSEGRPVGTVWAIAHTPERKFDAEDARLLTSLSRFAAAAYQMIRALEAAHAGQEGLERQVRERTGELEKTVEDLRREADERERAEEALRISEEKYRTLFTTMEQGFCIIEKVETVAGEPGDFRYVIANPAFERHTGMHDVVGKTIRELVSSPEQWVMDIYDEVMLTGQNRRFEAYVSELDLWIDVEVFPAIEPGQIAVLFSNVSERKRAEEALGESEERLRLVVESVHDYAIFTLDKEGRVTSWNEGARRTKGYTAEEIIGQPVQRFYTEEAAAAGLPEREMETALREGRSEDESWRVHKDGSLLWINEIMTPLRADDGTLLGFTKISRDLTERKRAEERLRASEERLRLLIESAEDYAIFTMTPDGRVSYWNAGAERVFGYTEEEIMGRSGAILFTPGDRERGVPEQEMRAAAAQGRASDERWHMSKNGTRFYCSGVMTALRYGGALHGFAKIARDLTLRKRAEDELRRAHDELEERVRERTLKLAESNFSLGQEVQVRRAAEEQVKGLLKQLVTVQEEERLRIARNIHDQLGQQMSALRLNLSSLHASCDGQTELGERARRTLSLAEELDGSIDFLTWELRPASLDHLGLSAALAHLVRGWSERFHITAEYHASGVDDLRLPPDSEINLYRLAQEALHNVYKHAGAKNVGVFIERRDGRVLLIVEDDGRGFDPDEVSHDGDGAGMGLIGMRERATLAGGELDVESAPGGGTAIYVRVSLAPSGDGGARR